MFSILRVSLVIVLLVTGLAVGTISTSAQDDIVMPEGTPITVGETVEGSLSAETPIVAYTFEGQEGDAISIIVEDESDEARYLLIADEDGDIIFYDSFDPIYQYTAHIPLYLLPDDGTYSVAVTTFDYYLYQEAEIDADFTFTLIAPTFTPIAYGESLNGTLSADHMFDLYVFEAEEGDIPYAVLEANQLGLEIYSITDPEFDELGSNTPPGSTNSYISPRFLIDDDQFFILVSKGYLYEEEPYTLTLNSYEPVPLSADAPAQVELTVETLSNYMVFEGEDGQEITLSAESSTALVPTLVLFDPDSDVIAVARDGDAIEELELKEDGEYVLAIFPGETLVSVEDLGTIKVILVVD